VLLINIAARVVLHCLTSWYLKDFIRYIRFITWQIY